jgi:hypothetical protein
MLWVFAALACHSSDRPENESPVDSDGDSAPTESMPDSEPPDTGPIDTGTPPDTTDPADNDGDGFAEAEGDCDDSQPDVHPGVEEVCGNGHDDNCNGTSDGCDWSGYHIELDGTWLYGSTDGWSAFGTSLAVCDANGDGVGDVVVGAPWYGDGIGAAYVFYGPIATNRDPTNADQILLGDTDGAAGISVDCRDIDGDAIDDIVVGEPGTPSSSPKSGAVYIVPGGGTGHGTIADVASSAWSGSDEEDGFGYQLVAIETDGDEGNELAVALAPRDQPATDYGTVYVIDDVGGGEHAAEEATAYIYGAASDRLGSVVGNGGDLDGDGLEELVVGDATANGASALVFTAPFTGATPESDADVRILGGPRPRADWSGIGHADLDGDGRDDLLLGNRRYKRDQGAAYVFFSPLADEMETTAADMQIFAFDNTCCFGVGSDVTSPGDVDGDGAQDLLVGASLGDTVYLQYGAGPGVYVLYDDAQVSWWYPTWSENPTSYNLAGAVLAAGDVTGDGVVDFVIGSPGDGYVRGEGGVTIVPAFDL